MAESSFCAVVRVTCAGGRDCYLAAPCCVRQLICQQQLRLFNYLCRRCAVRELPPLLEPPPGCLQAVIALRT